jgi:hypothetical protein
MSLMIFHIMKFDFRKYINIGSKIDCQVFFNLSGKYFGVKSDHFADYPLLRFSEAPEIEVPLVRGMKKPEGVGEPGLVPIAPAVANGLFAAAGIRMKSLPLTPEAVRAAVMAV